MFSLCFMLFSNTKKGGKFSFHVSSHFMLEFLDWGGAPPSSFYQCSIMCLGGTLLFFDRLGDVFENKILLYPRNLKFRGYYGFGPDAAAAAAACQGLCFT